MKVRGIIALLIAITMGFVGVKAVSYYLNKPTPQKTPRPVKKQATKPAWFADIPAGMRVVTVTVDDVSGIPGKLKTGDRVDVIATTPLPDSQNGKISRVILNGAKIYKIPASPATKASKRLGTPKTSKNMISLLLDMDNAAMLTAAANASDISVMIRRNTQTAGSQESGKESAQYSFTPGHGPRKIPGPTDTDYLDNIPKGMRAVTVPVTETDGICGMIRPGNHVDVLISSKLARVAGEDFQAGQKVKVTQMNQMSKLLLQNLKVLATESSVKGDSDAGTVSRATLLAFVQDAVVLTAALDASKKMAVKLISRGPGDTDIARTKMVEANNLFFEKYYRPHKIVVYKGADIQVMRF